MTVERIAEIAHEVNRAYCASLGDNSQVPWDKAPDWQKHSAIEGVRFHLSNGYTSPADSHSVWLLEKERDGWKWGPLKDASKKEHPCMLPYGDLPKEQQTKDVIFTALVKELMKEVDNVATTV